MRILAVGPHPDDIEFGCAPLLIQEARHGHEVYVVVTSKGEAATFGTPAERVEEARQAATLIGARIKFIDLGGDCHIEPNVANAMLMARQIREFRPHVVLAPSPDENQHPDHTAVSRIVQRAARLARYGGVAELLDRPAHKIDNLYFYAITTVLTQRPDILVDVTDVYEQWQAAMQRHKTQVSNKGYTDLVNARARTLGAAIGTTYAVGLWLNDPVRVNHISELKLSSRNF